MSFTSPKEQASAESARTQSQYATKLWDIAGPQLKDMLGRISGDLSPNGISPSVQGAFNTAREGVNKDFDTAGRSNQAYLRQAFAQSGGIYNTDQVNDANVMQAHNLDLERRNAMRKLNFQEASAGLGQYNQLMSLLGQGAGTALQLGGGFSADQARAIGGLSNSDPWASAGAGALSGAATGASAGPYGALAGGILGGLGGYFGGRG